MHNWQMHKWINQFLSYFRHTVLKKFSQIQIGVKIDRLSVYPEILEQRVACWDLDLGDILVIWDKNRTISRRKKEKEKKKKKKKEKQEVHGPHRSPEKTVQINKHNHMIIS